MMIVLRLVNITYKGNIYDLFDAAITLLIPIVILGSYIIFQKNEIYFLKGIDKKLIKENRKEINKIIEDYKNNYIDYELDTTFAINKIVFEGVRKPQVEKCLSLVGGFLDENRKKYTFNDYLIYYAKTLVIPLLIAITAALFLMLK